MSRRAGDAPFLTGFDPASRHRGLPGRWTSAIGHIELPASPLAAGVTLRAQACHARPGDAVEVFVDGDGAARTALATGRQTLAPASGSSRRLRHAA